MPYPTYPIEEFGKDAETFTEKPISQLRFIIANKDRLFNDYNINYHWFDPLNSIDHINIQAFGVAIVLLDDGTWYLEDTSGG